MRISLLHLSDLHFSETNKSVLSYSASIAGHCFNSVRNADLLLIVVTGDIAYAGLKDEYAIAIDFLNSIKLAVSKESSCPVHILVVPGNHDCVLKPKNSVREALIKSISEEHPLAHDDEIVKSCLDAQSHFLEFQSSITNVPSVFTHGLWQENEIRLNGEVLRFSLVNGAWMSQLPEQQGKLIFPVSKFEHLLDQPASLRIVLLHQPFNWFEQNTYQSFRKSIQGKAHIILTGHEHTTVSSVLENDYGSALYFESGAMQPHKNEGPSSFNLLEINTENKEITQNKYQIINGNIVALETPKTLLYSNDLKNFIHQSKLSDDFIKILNDPGGNFTHPVKDKIEIDDVFVYPDARNRYNPGDTATTINTKGLIENIGSGTKLLILGEEKSGKSILLYTALKEAHQKNFFPLYLRCSSINSVADSEIAKLIDANATHQYADIESFHTANRENRLVFLDDLDRLRCGPKFIAKLINYLDKHFSGIMITADTGFEVTELLTPEAAEILKNYDAYELMRFNHRLRLELVRKWCKCGNNPTIQEYDKKVHQVEATLNTVVGKNLVPSQPIYLLILLQSADQHQQSDLQNSSFAYYYLFLITKSLREVGVKPDKFNELFNYLSNLAWYYQTTDINQASFSELQQFNKVFSDKYVSVDLDKRLNLLIDAKILLKQDNLYGFAYPYIYFYFVGMYAAKNLSDNSVKQIVDNWCSNLNRRANAHSILFLTHHSNDTWIIDRIATILKQCFSQFKAMEFNGDTDVLNTLIDSATEILIEAPNVPHNQMSLRELQDSRDDKDISDFEKQDENDGVKFLNNINLMLRTAEILGQILKNYYGSLQKPIKAELLNEVVNAPLRLIRGVVELIINDPEAFITSIEGLLEDRTEATSQKKRRETARKLAFRLMGLVSTSFIIKSAQNINTESLEEDLLAYVNHEPTNSKKLIFAASKLTQAGKIPMDVIRKLAKELEPNAFAFTILQSLGVFHLYLFHTTVEEKQQLCSHLKINMNNSQSIDLINSKSKMLKKNQTT